MEFERLTQTSGMTVLEYEDCFSQLSCCALHMVPIDALRKKRFILELANPLFTMLSSHIGRITYAEVVDVALRIAAGQMERKASKDATKKPKVQGSFLGGPSSGEHFGSQSQQRNIQGGAHSLGPSQ